MFEPVILFRIGEFPIHAFSVGVALAAAIALLWLGKRIGADACLRFSMLAVPLGFIGARLFFCLVNAGFVFAQYGALFPLRVWQGGFAMFGGIGGVALAAKLSAKRVGMTTPKLLDAVCAPGMLFIGIERLLERFSGEGHGDYAEQVFLQRFPFSVQNVWGEWYLSVFLLEALAAFIILFILIRYEPKRDGNRALLMMILFGASQTLLESLRRDEFLRWGFVRVSQLAALALLVISLAILSVRTLRANGKRLHVTLSWLGAFLCAGVGIAMEFAVDKSPLPNLACYGIMGLAIAGIAAIALRLLFKDNKTFV